VFASKPVKLNETAKLPKPLRIVCTLVLLPYAAVGPHWKYAVLDEPLVVTDPFSVALLEVTFVAPLVDTANV
jgi:hypothetical protein